MHFKFYPKQDTLARRKIRREKRRAAEDVSGMEGFPSAGDLKPSAPSMSDLKPSAPPMEDLTPPPGYDFAADLAGRLAAWQARGSGSDSVESGAEGDHDSVTTSGFDWYNEQRWRGRNTETEESRQSPEEREGVNPGFLVSMSMLE